MPIKPRNDSSGKSDVPEFRMRGHDVIRLEAFSDVVFGFALTLLVVSLEVPHTFNELLLDMRGFVPFAISFAILAQVWWTHHDFFRRYGLQDNLTIVLNFILLFMVLFYTYPLKFLFSIMFERITGHEGVVLPNGQVVPFVEPQQGGLLMIVYGLGYATVFLIFTLLYAHALQRRQELELTALEAFDTKTKVLETGCMAFIGILSAVIAALLPPQEAGLAGVVFFLIAVGRTIIGTRRGAGRRKLTESVVEARMPEQTEPQF